MSVLSRWQHAAEAQLQVVEVRVVPAASAALVEPGAQEALEAWVAPVAP